MESIVKVKASMEEAEKYFYGDMLNIRSMDREKYVEGTKNTYVYEVRVRHEELPKKLPNRVYTFEGLCKAIKTLASQDLGQYHGLPPVKILGIVEYILPMYGNRRCLPYGKLKVTDGTLTKVVPIKDGTQADGWRQYFTFNRKRYWIKSVGSRHNPAYEVDYEYSAYR